MCNTNYLYVHRIKRYRPKGHQYLITSRNNVALSQEFHLGFLVAESQFLINAFAEFVIEDILNSRRNTQGTASINFFGRIDFYSSILNLKTQVLCPFQSNIAGKVLVGFNRIGEFEYHYPLGARIYIITQVFEFTQGSHIYFTIRKIPGAFCFAIHLQINGVGLLFTRNTVYTEIVGTGQPGVAPLYAEFFPLAIGLKKAFQFLRVFHIGTKHTALQGVIIHLGFGSGL